MKKNYYQLQVYYYQKGYITIYAYSGFRSNANRKFRSYLASNFPNYQSSVFRVLTYSSIMSMLHGYPSISCASFNP